MKPSTPPHSGKSGRDFVKRLQACLPQAKRKSHRLSANVTGEHTLKAEKEGFNSATKKIMISSSLRVVELTVPDKATPGRTLLGPRRCSIP